MSEQDGGEVYHEQDDGRLPTIDPEKEPEYVGAHSSLKNPVCQHYVGETVDEIERCENEATHTIVMWDGSKYATMASCDDCGSPEHVTDHEREWTGEVMPDA